MLKIRKSKDRGYFDHGWLKTYHSFSFADYFDPEHQGFKSLRVINEDFVDPQSGFGTHGHRDMNILTCIISGSLDHKDSMGHGSRIHAGEWQFMSAGTGVQHSEFNSSDSQVHLLQIWIRPSKLGLSPRYDQLQKIPEAKSFWRTVATKDGGKDLILLDQNASVHHAKMELGEAKSLKLEDKQGLWIQMIRGSLDVNTQLISGGDGMAVEDESSITITSKETGSEFILFEFS
jgi:redox-sensitive bicupin YhaK (pirin superfamily)